LSNPTAAGRATVAALASGSTIGASDRTSLGIQGSCSGSGNGFDAGVGIDEESYLIRFLIRESGDHSGARVLDVRGAIASLAYGDGCLINSANISRNGYRRLVSTGYRRRKWISLKFVDVYGFHIIPLNAVNLPLY
jgi:hypothetical protein